MPSRGMLAAVCASRRRLVSVALAGARASAASVARKEGGGRGRARDAGEGRATGRLRRLRAGSSRARAHGDLRGACRVSNLSSMDMHGSACWPDERKRGR